MHKTQKSRFTEKACGAKRSSTKNGVLSTTKVNAKMKRNKKTTQKRSFSAATKTASSPTTSSTTEPTHIHTHWTKTLSESIPDQSLFNSVALIAEGHELLNDNSTLSLPDQLTHEAYLGLYLDETRLRPNFLGPQLFAHNRYSPGASVLWTNSKHELRHFQFNDFLAMTACTSIPSPHLSFPSHITPKEMNPLTYTAGWSHTNLYGVSVPLRLGTQYIHHALKRQLLHWNYTLRHGIPEENNDVDDDNNDNTHKIADQTGDVNKTDNDQSSKNTNNISNTPNNNTNSTHKGTNNKDDTAPSKENDNVQKTRDGVKAAPAGFTTRRVPLPQSTQPEETSKLKIITIDITTKNNTNNQDTRASIDDIVKGVVNNDETNNNNELKNPILTDVTHPLASQPFITPQLQPIIPKSGTKRRQNTIKTPLDVDKNPTTFSHLSLPSSCRDLVLKPWQYDMIRFDITSTTSTASALSLDIMNTVYITIPTTVHNYLQNKYNVDDQIYQLQQQQNFGGGENSMAAPKSLLPQKHVEDFKAKLLSSHERNELIEFTTQHNFDYALPWLNDNESQSMTYAIQIKGTRSRFSRESGAKNSSNGVKIDKKASENDMLALESFLQFWQSLPPLDDTKVYNGAFKSPRPDDREDWSRNAWTRLSGVALLGHLIGRVDQYEPYPAH